MTRRDFLSSASAAATAGIAALTSPQGLLAAAREKAKPLHLKVTDLKTFIVNQGGKNSPNYVFVKIYTDQGITGLGEGSVTSKEATMAAAIEEHKRYLVGRDPTDIEMHWQAMYRWPRWRGGPILNSAISAVEIALWDILGQALAVPIYKLLGGAARKRVRMYLDVGASPEQFLRAKELGYTAAKTALPVKNNLVYAGSAVREGARLVESLRKAVGDDFDIAIDAHGRLTTTMAVDFCTRVEEL